MLLYKQHPPCEHQLPVCACSSCWEWPSQCPETYEACEHETPKYLQCDECIKNNNSMQKAAASTATNSLPFTAHAMYNLPAKENVKCPHPILNVTLHPSFQLFKRRTPAVSLVETQDAVGKELETVQGTSEAGATPPGRR